jgi:multiple sugar transport system substrate-binding protein
MLNRTLKPPTLALLLALTSLLAGCSCQEQAKPLTLQAYGDPAELDSYKLLIDAYQQTYPERKVEFIPVAKQKDHMAKLTTSFAAGSPPDVFLLNFRRFGQFAAKDVLAPVGDLLGERFKPQDFYPQPMEAFQWQGKQLCAAQNASSLVVYYNQRLFKEAGLAVPSSRWTMDEFVKAARLLTKDTNGDGKTDIYGVGIEPEFIRLAPFVWAFGGQIVDNLNQPTLFALDRDSAPRGVAFFRNLLQVEKVAPPLAVVSGQSLENLFLQEKVAMFFNSRRFTATLRQHNQSSQTNQTKLSWDVAAFPRLDQPVSVLHADGYCVAKASKNQPAAAHFIEFALGDIGQSLLSKTGRIVPVRRSVALSPAFLSEKLPPASAHLFLEALPTLRRTPTVAGWHEAESRADALVEEWYYEDPNKPVAGEAALESQLEGRGEDMVLGALLNKDAAPALTRE